MRDRRAWALALTAFVACAHADIAEPDGYRLGDFNAPVPATLRGGTVIHTDAAAELIKRDGTVVIDVSIEPRKPAELAPGAPWLPPPHRAVPGAVWLPGAGSGDMSAAYADFFRARLAQATNGNVATPVLIYCHENCWLSWNAAKRAIALGYQRVYWFPDGIEGWNAASLPSVTISAAEPARGPESSSRPPRLLVLDLELMGDLGGPDFAAPHEARLKMESARLREQLQKTQRYELVDATPARDDIERLKSQQLYLHDCNGCDLDIGRTLKADEVLVAWVDRVSGLILTLTYEIHDVATGQIIARKSFDFRGDNDTSWTHAVDYMIRHM